MPLDFMAFHKAQAFMWFSHFLQSEAQVKLKHLPKAVRNTVFFENIHIFLAVPFFKNPFYVYIAKRVLNINTTLLFWFLLIF